MNDDEALAELTRLRALEDAVREAGQLTRDGVFVAHRQKVWHPDLLWHPERNFGCVDLLEGDAEFVDSTFYPVCECYSNPERAEVGAKAGGAR